MSAVVIDVSAGVEIVADTRQGRALARLVPAGSEGWVPEHFYAEVLAVLRRGAQSGVLSGFALAGGLPGGIVIGAQGTSPKTSA